MNTRVPPALPKLPLGEAISLSYAWFFQRFLDVLRISWIWLVLGGILFGVMNWLQWSWMATVMAGGTKGVRLVHPATPPGTGFLMLLAYPVMIVGTASIAVAWHRRIILDEQPGLSGGNVVSGALWRYIGIGIVLVLMATLPALIVVLPTAAMVIPKAPAQPTAATFLLIPLVGVAYVTGLAILLRLSPLLPARATGDRSLGFAQAWRCTRGNTWRLFWGLIACSAPPLIVLQIISLLIMTAIGFQQFVPPAPIPGAAFAVPATGLTVVGTLFYLYTMLIAPLYIGFLSQGYRYLVRGGPDLLL